MKELPFDPLDPQRDRVYKAEESVFPRDKDVFMSLEELQVEADRVLALPWFARMFGLKRLPIKDGRGSKWSRSSDGAVHLIRISRVKDVLYHEIIHQVVPPGTEWHGAVFCGLLLYFIGRLYDQKTKDKLRRAFKRAEPPVVWDKRLARFGDLKRNGAENEG